MTQYFGSIIAECQVTEENTFEKIIDSILAGNCCIFVDTLDTCFICDIKKIPGRSINKSENEMNVKGPAESFIENLRTNAALIRKFIKDENLIFEDISVGNKGKTQCNLVYISGIANTSIINEVKRRIENIEIEEDFMCEHFIKNKYGNSCYIKAHDIVIIEKLNQIIDYINKEENR